MTPAPAGVRTRRWPYHTEEDMLRLEARAGIHAGMLPTNRAKQGMSMDGLTGGVATEEGEMSGWTAQQPYHHVDATPHVHALCGRVVDPSKLREHNERRCRVTDMLRDLA